MEAKMSSTQTDFTPTEALLAVSLELALASWKIALHDGKRANAAVYTVKGDTAQARLLNAIGVIKTTLERWATPANARIVVSYEAGQDGYWIQRELARRGYEAVVVDPASIPVERKARRAKTDRLDALRLVASLLAWMRGESGRMHVNRVPSAQAEAQRQVVRERGLLQKEIQQHRDRMRKLLRTVGCWDGERDLVRRLHSGAVRCHDGSALPVSLRRRLESECARLALAEQQFQELEQSLIETLPEETQSKIATLQKLKGVGAVGATRLVLELFWRNFDNRRQVGACVGLCPQPYDSGESRVDQGISKAGNRRVRALAIEMGWFWLRYQPGSELARWFARRTQGGGKRGKRVAIVAVARRLMITLWRYLKDGVLPQGALMKQI
jgi:transposase